MINNISEDEIKVLKELSTRKGVKGQRLIKDIIWLNEVESKFKKYDIVGYTKDDKYFTGIVEDVRYEFASRTISYMIKSHIIEVFYDTDTIESDVTQMIREEDVLTYSSKNENVVFVNTK